ncbi:M6 family metalloprotease domain-containing protein, partial [bacterium]|nr:M6 family metalloprotease domain-containing protein [bacterium]
PAAAGDGPQCVALPFSGEGPFLRADGLRAADGVPSAAPPAAVGSIHVLVILAEFADIPHAIPASRFPAHLFGTGATLRDYYDVLSGGRLDVTGDVVGWFTLPRTQTYYSPGNQGLGTYPRNGQGMAEDAVAVAVAAGVDLGDYDADGDGTVDALLVIHSGQGYEWAGSATNTPSPEPNAINSHKWVTLQSDFTSGAQVKDYFTCPELQIVRPSQYPDWPDSIATIGVYCHEFGHVLGLPDLYDTDTFLNRVGVWDVMDFGTWNRDSTVVAHSVPGALPGGFSSWCRMFLGWETPMEITPPAGEEVTQPVTLGSASSGAPPLQLLSNPGGVDWTTSAAGTGEYFLAEVRTRTGYDAGLPAEGVLLYHVDERESTNREADANFSGGGLLVLMPQDARLGLNTQPADTWPGLGPSGQATFDELSHPSSDLFSGAASGVTIAGITPLSGSSVSAIVSVTNYAPTPFFPFPRPMPWNPGVQGDVEIVLAAPGATVDGAVIRIFDVVGRPVRTLDGPGEFSEPGRVAVWDGRNDAGRRMPAGMYVFRVAGTAGGTGKVLLLR